MKGVTMACRRKKTKVNKPKKVGKRPGRKPSRKR